MTSDQRVITMLRGGLSPSVIAAVLGIDVGDVRAVVTSTAELPSGGGGGATVLHATDVPDQSIALVTPGQPQELAELWRVNGPGLIAVVGWYEIKPFDDHDYAGIGLMAATDTGGGVGSNGGPDARAFSEAGEILAGGWIRQKIGNPFPDILTPSQWRDYRLEILGFHYHDDDPGDTTAPALGNVQIRNMHVVAIRLDG